MFQWDRNLIRLAIPAERVLRLYRSLGQIQVALPGLASQQSLAYLCVYSDTQGSRVTVVFHLLESRRLAFYRDDLEAASALSVEAQRAAGMVFAESLGFLLDDLEIHLLDAQGRAQLWEALPLAHGGAHGLETVPESAGVSLTHGPVSGPPVAGELPARNKRALAALGRLLATL